MAVQAIGKESDNIEENEFIGEDAGPIEHPMGPTSGAKVAAFVPETQERFGISDRVLLDRAKVFLSSVFAMVSGSAMISFSAWLAPLNSCDWNVDPCSRKGKNGCGSRGRS